MIKSGFCGMRMRVNKARQDSISANIDFLCSPGAERKHFIIRADCEKSSSGNRDCLGAWLLRVHRPDVGVIKDEVWLSAFDRKE